MFCKLLFVPSKIEVEHRGIFRSTEMQSENYSPSVSYILLLRWRIPHTKMEMVHIPLKSKDEERTETPSLLWNCIL